MDGIDSELRRSGWIRHFEHFPVTDSTNLAAKRWLTSETSVKTPGLFVADQQTAGRGRGGHQWWSPDGCLMMTLVIAHDSMPTNVDDWGQLALIVGLSIAEAAQSLLEDRASVQLKWPNDVFLQGKKCGGILIESHADQYWLVGIGTNVQVDLNAAPEEVASRAISLHQHMPPSSAADARAVFLLEALNRLESNLTQWKTGQFDWRTPWSELCLLTGRIISVSVPGPGKKSVLQGRCEGVDAQGRLILRSSEQVHLLSSAEIRAW
ncbi:MAG: biotin--[acetyl-CoA-carboxylase] ligase [Aureliella sp.]